MKYIKVEFINAKENPVFVLKDFNNDETLLEVYRKDLVGLQIGDVLSITKPYKQGHAYDEAHFQLEVVSTEDDIEVDGVKPKRFVLVCRSWDLKKSKICNQRRIMIWVELNNAEPIKKTTIAQLKFIEKQKNLNNDDTL